MSHTPGPWRLFEGSKSPHCSSHTLSEILRPNSGRMLVRNPFVANDAEILEWNANARLIAASPELLMVLEKIVSSYDQGHLRYDAGVKGGEAQMTLARAAIAKATGQ